MGSQRDIDSDISDAKVPLENKGFEEKIPSKTSDYSAPDITMKKSDKIGSKLAQTEEFNLSQNPPKISDFKTSLKQRLLSGQLACSLTPNPKKGEVKRLNDSSWKRPVVKLKKHGIKLDNPKKSTSKHMVDVVGGSKSHQSKLERFWKYQSDPTEKAETLDGKTD